MKVIHKKDLPYLHLHRHKLKNNLLCVKMVKFSPGVNFPALLWKWNTQECLLYYIQRKIFFRQWFFLYSLCSNLEGIKDALCYKFRRPTIDQNCSAVCAGHRARDAFLNERREAPRWYCLDFLWVFELTVNNSCILAHNYGIKHTCLCDKNVCMS